MTDPHNFHVAWSPGERKYTARRADSSAFESVATTPQKALDQAVRRVNGGAAGDAATQPIPARTPRRTRYQPRVTPRWRTRC